MPTTTARHGTSRREALLATTLVATLLCGATAQPARADDLTSGSPTVTTDRGEVIGLREGAIDAFLGIPYAAPPVGDLRFRPPQRHAAWTTPIQPKLGAFCPQNRPTAIGSEDCLYLNVYTPANSAAANVPVMVWIPGGGFVQGSASSPYYDGQYIAEQAGVIVVTVTYRVGALGFLTSPALDKESTQGVSGNYGLLDQRAALRWVKRNIEAFGGNPRNVTVFGESAGADSIDYQLSAPATKGLYDRAIIESSVAGLLIPSLPIAVAESTGGAGVVSAVGCAGAADVVACLRALPATAFLAPAATQPGSSLPVVDGVVVPQVPLQAFKSGQFNHVPIILGSNHDEGTAFVWPIEAALGGALTAEGYAAQVQKLYRGNAAAVQAEYPVGAYPSPIQALATIYTDGNVACPTEQKREALSGYVRVFGYEFNEPNPAQASLLGPPEPGLAYGDYHTADLPYVFGVTAPNGDRLTAAKDLALSHRIIKYWTNLAKLGDPNVPEFQLPLWFDYRSTRLLLSLRDEVTYLPASQFKSNHHCGFWNTLPAS